MNPQFVLSVTKNPFLCKGVTSSEQQLRVVQNVKMRHCQPMNKYVKQYLD